jgi:hypothetical protein
MAKVLNREESVMLMTTNKNFCLSDLCKIQVLNAGCIIHLGKLYSISEVVFRNNIQSNVHELWYSWSKLDFMWQFSFGQY